MQSGSTLMVEGHIKTRIYLSNEIRNFLKLDTIHKDQAKQLLNDVEGSTDLESIRTLIANLSKQNKSVYITSNFFSDDKVKQANKGPELLAVSSSFKGLLKQCERILNQHTDMPENVDCTSCKLM